MGKAPEKPPTMPPDTLPPPRRRGFRYHGPRVLAFVVVLIALLVLVWDWNWFRPLVERKASAAIGRRVTLSHFDVNLGWHPLISADGITVANPDEFDLAGNMAQADRIAVRLDLRELFHRRLKLDELILDHPDISLARTPSGHVNWTFTFPGKQGETPDNAAGPEIAALTISDGRLHLADPKELKADVNATFETRNDPAGGEPQLVAQAQGRYNGQPVTASFTGGSVLTLRDPAHPYPVDLKITNGNTHVSADGRVLQPLTFGGADVTLQLSGDDLADLYPLTGVPLPHTAKYQLRGALDYAAGSIRFNHFKGSVGESDLSGDVAVTPGRGRRREVNATLHSEKVVLADLGGFIGATPGNSEAPTQTAKTRAEHAQNAASGKLLPD
ncbi:MAG TPA: AsmA family protein, partial [Nevskiaceae bacterium]|nr:AsmA family protein [Nevskiaceae bacterium]